MVTFRADVSQPDEAEDLVKRVKDHFGSVDILVCNAGGPPAVQFVNAQFEDAPLPREQFQAVFSASAFHWVDPAVSWQKAADVLVPGGTLALDSTSVTMFGTLFELT